MHSQNSLPAHYFTADLHLGHRNVIHMDGRPFPNLETHDGELTVRCRPEGGDEKRHPQLWLLGDVGHRAADVEAFMEAIRPYWSKIHLIRGNHDDRAAWKLRHLFDSAHEAFYLRINPEVRLYLSHYACRTWRNSHHGSIHLHGHSHGALPRWGRSMDVGTMLNCFYPYALHYIVQEMQALPMTNHH